MDGVGGGKGGNGIIAIKVGSGPDGGAFKDHIGKRYRVPAGGIGYLTGHLCYLGMGGQGKEGE